MSPRSQSSPSGARFEDHPWRRAPLELAIALGVWALLLWGFGMALSHSTAPKQAETTPSAAPAAEAAAPASTPSPSPTATPTPRPKATARPAPPPRRQAIAVRPTVRRPLVVALKPPATPRPTPTPVATPRPTPSVSASPATTSNAVAVYRPLPTLPDELRAQPIDVVAVARFHVAPDGSATVELAQPTPNPQLNQLLLATLSTWKFYPALENGQPVASTVLFRIPIKVGQAPS